MQSYGNDELVSMDATGSSYAAYDGEIGGVSGAYRYDAKAGTDIWNYQRRLEFYHTTPGARARGDLRKASRIGIIIRSCTNAAGSM